MAEQPYQLLPINPSQPVVKQEQNSPSASGTSSASDEKSTSSNPTPRRKRPSMSPNTAMLQPREPIRQRQKAKAMPTRGRGEPLTGSTMALPGLLDQTGEITYTPTTHRISKAKKGKKVHTCEYPGCFKVRYSTERRHHSC